MQVFSTRDVVRMLGLSPRTVRSFVRFGFVRPAIGPRGAWRFGFDDLVALRVGRDLVRAGTAPARVARSLRGLRACLPEALPSQGLRIRAAGDRVVVSEHASPWRDEAGQYLLDLSLSAAGGVADLVTESGQARVAAQAFDEGCALEEDDDPQAAQRAYRRALAAEPAHAGACANLGRLLHERGRPAAARAVYEQGLRAGCDDPLVDFNYAVLLEDLGDAVRALEHYERALARDPDFADAHHNLALLAESLGQHQKALRHLRAYRALDGGTRA